MTMNRKERRAAAKQDKAARGKGISAGQAADIEKAVALAQGGGLAEAEALLDAVRRSNPDHPEVNHQLGMIYVRTGRTEAGLQLLQRAVAALPQESLYWNNLAAAYLSIQRSQEAVDAARKAIALDPRNFMALQNLALGLRDLGDQSGAIEGFERAAEIGTLDPGSLATWGECLGAQRRFKEADAVVRRAALAVPNDPSILTLLAWLLVEQGNDAEARELFRKSLDLKADQFVAAFNFGVVSLRAGDDESGLRWLRRATSIDPKSGDAWRVLAQELARAGLKDEALPVAERAARLLPDDFELRNLVSELKGEAPASEDSSLVFDFDQPGETALPPGKDGTAKPEPAGVFDFSTMKADDIE